MRRTAALPREQTPPPSAGQHPQGQASKAGRTPFNNNTDYQLGQSIFRPSENQIPSTFDSPEAMPEIGTT